MQSHVKQDHKSVSDTSSQKISSTAFVKQAQDQEPSTPKKRDSKTDTAGVVRSLSGSQSGVQTGYIETETPSKPPGTTKFVRGSGSKIIYSSHAPSKFNLNEEIEYVNITTRQIDKLDKIMIGAWIERIASFDESFTNKSNIKKISIRQTIDQIFSPEDELKIPSTSSHESAEISITDDTELLLRDDSKTTDSSTVKMNMYDHLRVLFTNLVTKILKSREPLIDSKKAGKLDKCIAINLYADMVQLKYKILNSPEIPFARALCISRKFNWCPKSNALKLIDDITSECRQIFLPGIDLKYASLTELDKRHVVIEGRVKKPVFVCFSN